MNFVIELNGWKVGVQIDNPDLGQLLINQFDTVAEVKVISDLELESFPYSVVRVGSLLGDGNHESDFLQDYRIYAERKAWGLEKSSFLITENPTSLTVTDGMNIRVFCFKEEVDLAHIHHMIKYPLRHLLAQDGYVSIHASGVAINETDGILFVGPKGAGKTSILMEVLSSGCSTLGNDTVLLSLMNNKVYGTAWPHMYRLGKGTVNHNVHLHGYDFSPFKTAVDGKIELYIDVLNKVFKRPITKSNIEIKAVVEVKLVLNEDKIYLTCLNKSETKELIKERLLNDRFATGWLPGWRWEEDLEVLNDICQRIIDSNKVFRLVVGSNSIGWGRGKSAVLQLLNEIVNQGAAG